MDMVKLVQDNGVTPVLVFDGCSVPIKKETDDERKRYLCCTMLLSRQREKSFAKGDVPVKRITFEHYIPVIRKCIEKKIYYMIAPYEADGQISYLAKNRFVDLVIAEDTDYLVHGCEKLLTKLNSNGNGELYIRSELFQSESLGLQSFDDTMFRYWCILSKCDYLRNIKGVGIKRALEAVKQGKTREGIFQCLSKYPIPES